MKKLLTLGLLAAALLPCARRAPAASTQILAYVQFTNVVRGVTNGDTITVNGDVRRYTNGTLAGAATWIQSTNIVGWAATNTLIQLNTYVPTSTEFASPTNTNVVIIAGSVGNATHTVSVSSGVGTVTYGTNIYADYRAFGGPLASLVTAAARTNVGSLLIEALGNTYTTNLLPYLADGSRGFSNWLDRGGAQTASNKSFYLTTNNGGLSDGRRITNFIALSGSNGTINDLVIQRGRITELTNLTGTNVALTNVTLRHVTFIDANPRGTNVGFTNGFLVGATNVNPVNSNTVNYGNALRSEGEGGNSFQVGSNALARGLYSVAIGNNALATNAATIAIGNSAWATNQNAIALGNGASAYEDYSISIGNNSTVSARQAIGIGYSLANGGPASVALGYFILNVASNGVAIGATAVAAGYQSAALGYNAQANAAHSAALGPGARSDYDYSAGIGTRDHLGQVPTPSTTNQIRLGTSLQTLSVPGLIVGPVSSNALFKGTNVLDGDFSTPRATFTTIVNSNNLLVMGTNVVIDITGSPTSTWNLDGIKFGSVAPRDGHQLFLRNGTGYDAIFVHNSGYLTGGDAVYRITTFSSQNIIFTNGGTAHLIYSAATARWTLWNSFGGVGGASGTLSNYYAGANMSTGPVVVATSVSTNLFTNFHYFSASRGIGWTNTGVAILTNAGDYLVSFGGAMSAAGGVMTLLPYTNGAAFTNCLIQHQANTNVETGFKSFILSAPANATVELRVGNSTANNTTNHNVVLTIWNLAAAIYSTNLLSTNGPMAVWTNGVAVTTGSTNLDLVAGTNIVLVATNTNGKTTVQINSSDAEIRLFALTNDIVITNVTAVTSALSNYTGTLTIPANWWQVGSTVRLRLWGRYFNGATTTHTNRITLGGTIVATNTLPLIATLSDNPYNLTVEITCRATGASGSVTANGVIDYPTSASGNLIAGRRLHLGATTATIDTTAAQAIGYDIHPGATTQAFQFFAGHCMLER